MMKNVEAKPGRSGMKKKAAAGALAAAMLATALPVSAGESQVMELTLTKPAQYVMTIPSSQNHIAFGAEDTVIGNLKVTGDVGAGQQVEVSITKTDFVEETNQTLHFGFSLFQAGKEFAGEVWSPEELKAATPKEIPLTVHIPSSVWEEAVPGSYKAEVTFKAELKTA